MQTDEGLMLLVGGNVRRLRHMAGMTASQAAARGGVHVQMWWRIESGKLNAALKTLAKVCAGLDVDVTALFEEPPKRNRNRQPRKSSVAGSRITSTVFGARRSSRSSKPRTRRRSTSGTGEG